MWSHKNTYAIGGLENIGYADNSDNLIVLSSQGRGIFNCVTGEKINRDSIDWWSQFDELTSTINGFGLLENAIIKTSGLYGKYLLPKETTDGWSLVKRENEFDDHPFEKNLVTKIFLASPTKEQIIFISKDGPCELRSFGFSPTGHSLIVALSCELTIWSRNDID
jgi:hypothetical protein